MVVAVGNSKNELRKYVKEHNAIFIDDSFAERKKVREATGVPVFGVDMVESLLDWKV